MGWVIVVLIVLVLVTALLIERKLNAEQTTGMQMSQNDSIEGLHPMALINCPDCNKEISRNAPTCPGCGAPIANAAPKYQKGDFIPYTDQEVQVMLSKKKTTSHLLHLILCIPTVGFWIIIWLLVATSNGSENARIDRMIAKGKKIR